MSQFSPPEVLNSNAAEDSDDDFWPELAGDGSGTWMAVWGTRHLYGLTGSDSDIAFAISHDNMETWSAPAVVNSDAFEDEFSDSAARVATDGLGTWIVVWRFGESLEYDIRYAVSDDGETWSPPEPLNTNAATDTGRDEEPEIATDGAGNWIVVWESRDPLDGSLGTDADILFAVSTNNGTSWSAPAPLNTNAAVNRDWDLNPYITTDGQGAWMTVWDSREDIDGAGDDGDIFFALSLDNGGSWSPPAAVNNAGEDALSDEYAHLVSDGQGSWMAAWQDTYHVFSTTSTDNGATWTPPQRVDTTEPGFDDKIRLATDGAGHWIAVWYHWTTAGVYGEDRDIQSAISTDGGGSWTASVPVNTNAFVDTEEDLDPVVACDGVGRCYVCWRSKEDIDGTIDTDLDILLSRFVLPDCNRNGVLDDQDIAGGSSADDDANGIPDECESDADADGVLDGCDNCALFNPEQVDCQFNGVGDVCDLDTGASADCDANGIPDECQLDCDADGLPNVCEACIAYVLEDLGMLGPEYEDYYAQAINDLGQVVGYARTADFADRAFLWDNGVMVELPPLPGDIESVAYDINDAGQVIGNSQDDSLVGFFTAVLWEHDGRTWQPAAVSTSGGSRGRGLNEAGQMAGYDASDFCPNPGHVAWSLPGGYLALLPGGSESEAYAINDAGFVVGTAGGGCLGESEAVMWSPEGDITSLGAFDAWTIAYGVNALRQVVGYGRTWEPSAWHAFLWLPQSAFGLPAGFSDLGTCGGDYSRLNRISDAGVGVGTAEYADGTDHAVLWSDGHYYDLNNMIAPGSGWQLRFAYDINDHGQIVGYGRVDDQDRAFLLTPLELDDLDGDTIPDICEEECTTTADCADLDGDGIRDDGCVFWACRGGECVDTPIVFGEMGGQFGACPPDGAADGNDRFHALSCFANTRADGGPYGCEYDPPFALNVDTGGEFGDCSPDGVCDGNDAFHALNAFGGTSTCSCPLDGDRP